jgi:saccharopine dehydrogenase-like NADP-dependent oxidoreductase
MRYLVLGAGMMGRAIAYDLSVFSAFEKIMLGDKDSQTRNSAKQFLKGTNVDVIPINADKIQRD